MHRRSHLGSRRCGFESYPDTIFFFLFSSSPKLEGLHECRNYADEDYEYLLHSGHLFDVAVVWRIVKRKDCNPEERYCTFIQFKLVSCGIVLRNKTSMLPVVKIPRIYNQKPGICYCVESEDIDNWMIESELFYKILLQDHRV